jgi:hypothetical protein
MRIILIALAGIATTALTSAEPNSIKADTGFSWLAAAPMGDCGECQVCGINQHFVDNGGGTVGAPHSTCIQDPPLGCVNGHPQCTGGPPKFSLKEDSSDKLWSVVALAAAGDIVAQSELFRDYADQVVFVPARQALQLRASCNPEKVIAHIPVPAGFLATLNVEVSVAGDR